MPTIGISHLLRTRSLHRPDERGSMSSHAVEAADSIVVLRECCRVSTAAGGWCEYLEAVSTAGNMLLLKALHDRLLIRWPLDF